MKSTDTPATYRVNEIFCSLQGEGYHTGSPAVFIRFSGCNRACPFCDTDHLPSITLTAREIAAEASKHTTRFAILTGGEPLLQADAELLDTLHAYGFTIAVETNGTLPVPNAIDWVTCSPKEPPLAIDRIDELKVVWQDTDPDNIAARLPEARHHFIQPCSGQNIPEIVDYLKAHPRWRLSLQTHKLINIP